MNVYNLRMFTLVLYLYCVGLIYYDEIQGLINFPVSTIPELSD